MAVTPYEVVDRTHGAAHAMLSRQADGRRRILYVDHTASLGGGEIALRNLVTNLDPALYEAAVVLFADGPLVGQLREAGVPTYVLPLSPEVQQARKDSLGGASLLRLADIVTSVRFVLRLARFIRRHGPDIVHTNSLKADILGGAAARLAGRPVVWHVRDRISPDYLPSPIVRLFRVLCRCVPSHVIANSHSTLDTLGLPSRKGATAVYSGLNRMPDETDCGRSLDTRGTITLGLVGRISPWKGQDVFVRAAAKVHERYPNARFVMIGAPLFGEEEYERQVRRLADELGLADVVEFTGFRHDIMAEVSKLDVLVHASTTPEPFGQVIVEGMAAAKPVIATNGGGAREIVKDGETGLLVPMGDADALADAMLRILDAPGASIRMGLAGRARVAEHFTVQRTVERVEAVYSSVMAGVPTVPSLETTHAVVAGVESVHR